MLEINSGCSSKILHVAMKFSGEITPEWTQNTHSNINMSFSCQHKIWDSMIELSLKCWDRNYYTVHFFSSLIIKVIPWRNTSSKHYRQINKHCIYMTKILQWLFFFYLWISSLHFTVWFQFQNSYNVNMISMKLFVLFLINQLWSSIYLSEKWIKLR